MTEDLYARLGVKRNASAEEIRKAYKKIAKESHPDLNPGDPGAEARFKEASAAYEILKDPEKRGRYDRGEIDATGAERAERRFYREYAAREGGPYHTRRGFQDFEGLGDIFDDLFGRSAGGRGMRGQDLRYALAVEFLEAVKGAVKRIQLPTGETLDVRIPEGTADGETIRLKGKGAPGLGGGPGGDALVTITVRPHRMFRREGDDIESEVPVTIDEAVLGAKIEVATIDGRVSLTVPKGSSSGQVLRLRGKGVKRRGGTGRGDHLVKLRIVLPPKGDAELETFLASWRQRHRYDPRKEGG
ncbi:MAG TPA: DnaJ C-terminal domain-containing protein [Paracoccaceae bacterium]|nr:DnaJ C-terminal domain-containing protein [Paracoccaceae bacterium]